MEYVITAIILVILALVIYVTWRIAKGHSKLEAANTVRPHEHIWSPWDDHEVALYDGPDLVRYAPGQLRTCLDLSCNAEDVRMVGGQHSSGERDLP